MKLLKVSRKLKQHRTISGEILRVEIDHLLNNLSAIMHIILYFNFFTVFFRNRFLFLLTIRIILSEAHLSNFRIKLIIAEQNIC